MIITISGVPGSGKTSVAKILAGELGMPFYSMGGLRAKLAQEKGMTLDELNAHGEQDHTTDTSVDEYQKELGKTSDNFIVEGRLSWHFIPHSFKIFLDCQPAESARRIYEARKHADGGREDEPAYLSPEEARKTLDERMASDARRYSMIYGVDYRDLKQYDLVLDTTEMKGPEETAEKVLDALKMVK